MGFTPSETGQPGGSEALEGDAGSREKREAKSIISSLIILIIIVTAYIIIRIYGGFAVVEGRSMEPLLHTGDLVILKKAGPDDIEVGDIVVYKSNGKYIIHRVVGVYESRGVKCFIVKGDNNVFPDRGDPCTCGRGRYDRIVAYGIPYTRIVGVVVEVWGVPLKIPYIGALTLLVKD